MNFCCLCPTFGRPTLVSNAVKLFLSQRLANGDVARMWIFDDADQLPAASFGDHSHEVHVITVADWIPLPRKYDALLARLHGSPIDNPNLVYVVWDDDDIYTADHLAAIGEALRDRPQAGWAHPRHVWSTYDERRPARIPRDEPPRLESAQGRFHGALAVRGSLLHRLGGWPDTDLATYDQLMLALLSDHECVDPTRYAPKQVPTYCYRWQDTARWHASGSIDQDGRYKRPPIQEPGRVERILPAYDESTAHVLRWLAQMMQQTNLR